MLPLFYFELNKQFYHYGIDTVTMDGNLMAVEASDALNEVPGYWRFMGQQKPNGSADIGTAGNVERLVVVQLETAADIGQTDAAST